MNNGKEYEEFVTNLQQALINSEQFIEHKNILIERNTIITDRFGIKREFDLYWEYELAGIVYRTVVECKDYKSKISIDKIDAFIGKTQDIPDLRLIFATKSGYQKGANEKAAKHKIELLIVREQNDSDWEDQYGNPYLKEINMTMRIMSPPRLVSFNPKLDLKWAEENKIDTSEPIPFSSSAEEIIINDLEKNETKSLLDIYNSLELKVVESLQQITKEVEFNEAFLEIENMTYKIRSYSITYQLSPPTDMNMLIDYSKELLGVIEYLNRGVKKSIYKKGKIVEEIINDR